MQIRFRSVRFRHPPPRIPFDEFPSDVSKSLHKPSSKPRWRPKARQGECFFFPCNPEGKALRRASALKERARPLVSKRSVLAWADFVDARVLMRKQHDSVRFRPTSTHGAAMGRLRVGCQALFRTRTRPCARPRRRGDGTRAENIHVMTLYGQQPARRLARDVGTISLCRFGTHSPRIYSARQLARDVGTISLCPREWAFDWAPVASSVAWRRLVASRCTAEKRFAGG